MELWGAEYQENDAILVHAESRELLQSICDRERVPIAFCGTVTGDGRVVLDEGNDDGRQHPYDLDLGDVLGGLPPKTFVSDRAAPAGAPLVLPTGTTVVRWFVCHVPCCSAESSAESSALGASSFTCCLRWAFSFPEFTYSHTLMGLLLSS